jgi:hypothetical protein
MKLTQGKIVKWENKLKQQIIWMVIDDTSKGVVIHSEGLLSIGSICDLTGIELTAFAGTVNISSTGT